MKKLIVLVAMSLVASLAFSQDLPKGAVLLGERTVEFHADHDVIPVGTSNGWFKGIIVWVEKNDIEIFNIRVTYGDGEKENFDPRLVFDKGRRTHVLHLKRGERMIRSIAFTYKTIGSWLEGRARVVVYGIR